MAAGPSSLWLYYLLAALSFLVGLQFLISWILMRVLEELSHRVQAAEDLGNRRRHVTRQTRKTHREGTKDAKSVMA